MKEIKENLHQSDEIEINSSGKSHQIKARGDSAKGLAASLSVLCGFIVGFLLIRRF
jgi:hypothetical protein